MKLLKRSGMFGNLPDGVRITRATTTAELTQAYALVHDAFVERGYIRPARERIRVRIHEALPAMATFIAEADDQVVGVQSLITDDPDLGLPSDAAFKPEIDRLRAGGSRVCEATNEATAAEYRRSCVPTDLMRCCFAQAVHTGSDYLITTISPGHVKFYELLGFEQVGDVRSYSKELDDPVALVSLDLNSLAERFADVHCDDGDDEACLKLYYIEGNPYPDWLEAWDRQARELFANPLALREIFWTTSRLIQRLDDAQVSVLKDRWGEQILASAQGRPAGVDAA
jgi:hypothetical protein